MSRRAVLDACVLVPYNLASLLLTLAEHGLFEPRWSETILEETHRALTNKIGLDEPRAARRRDAMQHAFPEAEVAGFDVDLQGLAFHPKDRHVLAAAIASDADVIVTFNLDDFPVAACAPHGVAAVHPEEYLLELLAVDREATLSAVIADAARRTSPPAGPSELLAWLAATVPTFASTAHQTLQDHGPISDIPAYVIADPADSPLSALAKGGDLTDPLDVVALWWLAVLDPNRYQQQLRWLTHAPGGWGDVEWAATLLRASPSPSRCTTPSISPPTSPSSGSSPRSRRPDRPSPRPSSEEWFSSPCADTTTGHGAPWDSVRASSPPAP